jgi:hypothetical protein
MIIPAMMNGLPIIMDIAKPLWKWADDHRLYMEKSSMKINK